jgi:hypothetical protein
MPSIAENFSDVFDDITVVCIADDLENIFVINI